MKVDNGEKDHAEYSASGSSRWLNCPGSLRLSKEAPEPSQSKYAEEGTKAHACLEFLLKNRRELSHAVSGPSIEMAREVCLDDDMVDHAIEAAKEIIDWHKAAGGSELLCETKVDSSSFTCDGQFGTVDAAIIQEFGRLVVIDFKYGAGVAVDPEGEDGRGNSQLVYYALGIAHQYNYNFSQVELVVIQPRAYHASGNTTRTFMMPMSALLEWIPVFRAGVERSLALDAPLASGPWCKFCPAGIICPRLKDDAMQEASVVFDDGVLQSVPVPSMILLPSLGQTLDACVKLEQWIEKVREHALHVSERGHHIDGWKLVEKRSTRKWVDYEKATTQAWRHFGEIAFTKPELLSPAQMEKALKVKSNESQWVNERVTSQSSGVTLVPDKDKREAVNRINDVFGIL